MAEIKYKGQLSEKISDKDIAIIHPETSADQVIYSIENEGTSTEKIITVKDKLDNVLGENGTVANADTADKLKHINSDSKASPIYLTGVNGTNSGSYEGEVTSSLWYLPPNKTLYVGNVEAIKNGIATKAKADADGNSFKDWYPKLNSANGTIPSSYLPGYVDDVIDVVQFGGSEDAPTFAYAIKQEDGSYVSGEQIEPEYGKIYINVNTNVTYRWSGSKFVEISSSLALGDTAETAYAGDKGAANAKAIEALQTSLGDYALKANFKYLGETTVDPAVVKPGHPLLNAMFPAGGGTVSNQDDITPTIYVFRYFDNSYYHTYLMVCDWSGAANYRQTIYGPNGRLVVRESVTGGANGTGGGDWRLVKDGTIALTSNVPSVSNYIEVGEEGQTTPSDNLVIGGLFFKRKS